MRLRHLSNSFLTASHQVIATRLSASPVPDHEEIHYVQNGDSKFYGAILGRLLFVADDDASLFQQPPGTVIHKDTTVVAHGVSDCPTHIIAIDVTHAAPRQF
jgi:hypothetical protein